MEWWWRSRGGRNPADWVRVICPRRCNTFPVLTRVSSIKKKKKITHHAAFLWNCRDVDVTGRLVHAAGVGRHRSSLKTTPFL